MTAVAMRAVPPTTTEATRNQETGPVASVGGVAGVVSSSSGEGEADGVGVAEVDGVGEPVGLGVAVATTVCSMAMAAWALAALSCAVPAKDRVRVSVPAGCASGIA